MLKYAWYIPTICNKYAQICKQYVFYMHTYAWICMHMHKIWNKYAKNMQKICYPYAIHMLNICWNMQEYDKNMHKYAIVKYAQICTNMQKICKKYAQICNNMQGLGTLQNRQKYANYMHKYASICNICNQWFHMQNMHEYALPTLLTSVRCPPIICDYLRLFAFATNYL